VVIVRQSDLYEMPLRREAEALVAAGFDVEVICMRGDGRPNEDVVSGVRVTGLPASLSRSRRILYVLQYAWFCALAASTLTVRHLRRRYTVVQVNTMPDFLVFAAVVPKLLGARVLAYMKEPIPELAQTMYGHARLTRLFAWIEQRALQFADHALTVTQELKDRYVERGADPERITVVLNGAAPETLLDGWSPRPAAKNGFTVLSHGSVEERYGQDTLVEAAALLRGEVPDMRVVLTGRGSGVDDLLTSIEELGVGDIVDFKGWVSWSEIADLLYLSDVGVVAQKASPYSHLVQTNKMVDYWIFGKPVIASRLRSVSELYDDSVLEYFEPGDAQSLADAIRRLWEDPGRREELARNGKRALEQNGWDVQKEIYVRVYERLLGEQAHATRTAEDSSQERSA
jgi:glycosyltransferase involved in cell wall biosynthesis